MISPRTFYLTRDGRAVEDGDPEAAFLLVRKGTEILEADARRYKLPILEEKKSVDGPQGNTSSSGSEVSVEDKAVPGPQAGPSPVRTKKR